MSPPTFHTYPGIGQTNSDAWHYSQAVRIGSQIRTSGQAGLKDDGEVIGQLQDQLRQAFRNVEKALKDAGGKGWSQVVSMHTYHIDLDGSFEATVECMKEFMPQHRPIWVAVGVAKLGEGLHVEMEVEANTEL